MPFSLNELGRVAVLVGAQGNPALWIGLSNIGHHCLYRITLSVTIGLETFEISPLRFSISVCPMKRNSLAVLPLLSRVP